MVRRGSTVRVRQRAPTKSLLSGRFCSNGRTLSSRTSALRQLLGNTFSSDLRLCCADFALRVDRSPASQIVDDMRVRAEERLQRVSHLRRDLDVVSLCSEKQRGHAVPQVVGSARDTGGLGGTYVSPSPPVPVVVIGPRSPLASREHERISSRVTGDAPPLLQVVRERSQQLHVPRSTRFRVRLNPQRQSLVDADRLRADVAPTQGERLVRPQPGIREHRDESRVTGPFTLQQLATKTLDRERRQRADRPRTSLRRLRHVLRRIVRDPAPLDCALQNPLQHRERLPDRLPPRLLGFQLKSERLNALRRQPAYLKVAKLGDDEPVAKTGVHLERLGREVRLGVKLPPLANEGLERLLAGVERGKFAPTLRQLDRRLPSLGVALAGKRSRPKRTSLVSPKHTVDGPVLALATLNRHR